MKGKKGKSPGYARAQEPVGIGHAMGRGLRS